MSKSYSANYFATIKRIQKNPVYLSAERNETLSLNRLIGIYTSKCILETGFLHKFTCFDDWLESEINTGKLKEV